MRFKFAVPALTALATIALATTMAAPANAQYARVYGPGYHGPSYYGPAYRARGFRGVYNEGPTIGPLFYGGGWVPEPIFDHSRTGGIDPNIRTSD